MAISLRTATPADIPQLEALIARKVYPAETPEGNPNDIYSMVSGWGARWHEWRGPFECPHCKEAQPTITKLLADYPSAHFVFQDFPLTQIHNEAFKASTHGYCVAKAGGNEAFFKFSDALFENQAGLTAATADATLKDAETKAGQDPVKIAACAATPAAKDAINASLALGAKVGVNSTPTIFINGRGLPAVGIPYPMLQKIIEFQAQLDGVPLPPAPPAPAPKPAPSLR